MAQSAVATRHSAGEDAYGVVDGPHSATYRVLFASDFLLRADLPLDRSAGFVSEAHEALSRASVLLDFGCGRVMAGLPSLSDEAWMSLCGLAARSEGHLVLEKAPADFKARHDVFGPARPDWPLMHRLKSALDPHGVFAPGRLPGRR